MSIKIRATIDVRKIVKNLDEVKRKQVPFAMAHALTLSVNSARDDVRRDMRRTFTVRNKRVQQGMRSRRATKRDLTAYVFHVDEFMIKQTEGDSFLPKRSRHFFYPVRARRSKNRPIAPTMRPKVLFAGGYRSKSGKWVNASKRLIILPFDKQTGEADAGLFRIQGRGANQHLRLLYAISRKGETADYRKRWDMAKEVERSVNRRFNKHFGFALARAIATRRK